MNTGIILMCLGNRVFGIFICVVAVLIEVILLVKYDDVIYYSKYRFVDLYLKDGSVIKDVEIQNLQRKGSWISLLRIELENEEEIRVRENELTKITYHGASCYIKENKGKYTYLE